MIDGVQDHNPLRTAVSHGRPLDDVALRPGPYKGTAPLDTVRSSGRAAPADQVTLSPEAQLAAAAQGPIEPVSLHDLPAKLMDFDALMQRAETRLGQLMGQLGMPRGTDVTIRSDRAGNFTVESDHPKAAELEAAINEDPEMRNAMIGASNAATLNRLVAATEQAMRAADANPAMTERYYDWLLSVAKETQAMPFHFEMSGGTLTGGFTGAQGQVLAITDGLNLPA